MTTGLFIVETFLGSCKYNFPKNYPHTLIVLEQLLLAEQSLHTNILYNQCFLHLIQNLFIWHWLFVHVFYLSRAHQNNLLINAFED